MKKILLIMTLAIAFVVALNLSQINPDQHWVSFDNGGYWRSNPNSTIADNIGENTADIKYGLILVVVVGAIIYWFNVFSKEKPKKIEEGRTFFERARNLEEEGKYEEALKLYENLIQIDPGESRAYCLKGFILASKLGEPREALKNFDKAIEIDRDYFNAYQFKAITLNKLQCYEEAASAYSKMAEMHPEEKTLYIQKGLNLSHACRFEDAIKAFDEAIAVDSEYLGAYHEKGKLLVEIGKLEEAIEMFDKVIEIDPERWFAYHERGEVLVKLLRFEEAMDMFEVAESFNPDYEKPSYRKFFE